MLRARRDSLLSCQTKLQSFWTERPVSKLPGLVPFIEAFSPELVHIQTITEVGGLGLKYAQKHQLPVVCTLHDLQDVQEGFGSNRPAVLLNKRQCQMLFKKILSGSDVVTTASPEMCRGGSGAVSCQIHRIPYCVDTERFCPRSLDDPAKEEMRTRMHLTDGKIGFVFSGRLCAETRVEELLACWGKR